MKTPAEMLAEGRAWLESHGWARGDLHDGDYYCALGALLASQDLLTNNDTTPGGLRKVRPAVKIMVHDVLERSHEDVASCLTSWNDSTAQNKQEVIDLFAKAEKIARAGFDPDKGVEV